MTPQPETPLPAYTHIPGVTPHPLGDPQGHSFGQVHAPCDPPHWSSLLDCELFQRARRLFNAGYYWEAHEAWEGVWIAVGRAGLVADFLKGLIKLAAAGVKLREGSLIGAQRHLTRSEELLLLTRTRLLEERQLGSQPDNNLGQLLVMVKNLRQILPPIPAPNSGQPISLLGQI